jgi:hypothetical protein
MVEKKYADEKFAPRTEGKKRGCGVQKKAKPRIFHPRLGGNSETGPGVLPG